MEDLTPANKPQRFKLAKGDNLGTFELALNNPALENYIPVGAPYAYPNTQSQPYGYGLVQLFQWRDMSHIQVVPAQLESNLGQVVSDVKPMQASVVKSNLSK